MKDLASRVFDDHDAFIIRTCDYWQWKYRSFHGDEHFESNVLDCFDHQHRHDRERYIYSD